MKINLRIFLNTWAKFGLGYSIFVVLTIILIVTVRQLSSDFIYSIWLIMFGFWFVYVLFGVVVLIVQIAIEIVQKYRN